MSCLFLTHSLYICCVLSGMFFFPESWQGCLLCYYSELRSNAPSFKIISLMTTWNSVPLLPQSISLFNFIHDANLYLKLSICLPAYGLFLFTRIKTPCSRTLSVLFLSFFFFFPQIVSTSFRESEFKAMRECLSLTCFEDFGLIYLYTRDIFMC